MKENDLELVYTVASTLWRNFKVPDSEVGRKVFDMVWFNTLKPYELKIITLAMQNYARGNNFCNITQVGLECENIIMISEGYDADLVIEELNQAKSLTMYEENFAKLSDFAKEVCGSASWLRELAKVGVFENRKEAFKKKAENLLELKKKQKALQRIKSAI